MANVRQEPVSLLGRLLNDVAQDSTSDIVKQLNELVGEDRGGAGPFKTQLVNDTLTGRKDPTDAHLSTWARWWLQCTGKKSLPMVSTVIETFRQLKVLKQLSETRTNVLQWTTPRRLRVFLPPIGICFPMAGLFGFHKSNGSRQALTLGTTVLEVGFKTRGEDENSRMTGPRALDELIAADLDKDEVGFAVSNPEFLPAGQRDRILVIATMRATAREKRLLLRAERLLNYTDYLEPGVGEDRRAEIRRTRVATSGRIKSLAHYLAYCLLHRGGPTDTGDFKIVAAESSSIAGVLLERMLEHPQAKKDSTVLGALRQEGEGTDILRTMWKALDHPERVASEEKLAAIRRLRAKDIIKHVSTQDLRNGLKGFDLVLAYTPYWYAMEGTEDNCFVALADDYQTAAVAPNQNLDLDRALREGIEARSRKQARPFFNRNQPLHQEVGWLLNNSTYDVCLVARKDQKHMVAPLLRPLMRRLSDICGATEQYDPERLSTDQALQQSWEEYIAEMQALVIPDRADLDVRRRFEQCVYKDLTFNGIRLRGHTDLPEFYTKSG